MGLLRALEIKNYLSHQYTYLDNIEDLFAFIGENDCGKSNIWEAINMVVHNEPWPEEDLFENKLTKERTKSGFVRIVFDDGREITRERDGKSQSVTLVWEDGTTDVYKTVKGLDETIAGFTGFAKIRVDKSDSTPESLQLIPIEEASLPFMISGIKEDGILRRLNRLAFGAGFESAKVLVDKDIRAREADLRVANTLKEQSERVVKVLEEDDWGVAEGMVAKAETLVEEACGYERKAETLTEIQDKISTTYGIVALRGLHDKLFETVSRLSEVLESYDESEKELEDIKNLEASINSTKQRLIALYRKQDELTEELESLSEILAKAVCETCGQLVKISTEVV
jgi:DNA repair exonuclease SbcCD ATPase subunit